jgi:hypothetical protein
MRFCVKAIKWLEMKKSVLARISRLQAEGKCLSCEGSLEGKRSVRGDCLRCYKATLRAIAGGLTTDEARTEEGKWLSCALPGRKPSNPVTVELRR